MKMITVQVVKTSVTVNNNSPIHNYVHADDHTQPTYEMTPGCKPFTGMIFVIVVFKLLTKCVSFIFSDAGETLVHKACLFPWDIVLPVVVQYFLLFSVHKSSPEGKSL